MQHSHIVAIKTTGNVFSHDAVQQFNVKLKSWRDLITEEPFTRKDIITIQVHFLHLLTLHVLQLVNTATLSELWLCSDCICRSRALLDRKASRRPLLD